MEKNLFDFINFENLPFNCKNLSDSENCIHIRIDKNIIDYLNNGLIKYEEYLKSEFKSKYYNVNEFVAKIPVYTKALNVIIENLHTFFNLYGDISQTVVHVQFTQFDYTTSILFQVFYNGYEESNVSFHSLMNEVENKNLIKLSEVITEIRNNLKKLLQIHLDQEDNGNVEHYIFDLPINADNSEGFFLQTTDL